MQTGHPCTRCGTCCRAELCGIALDFLQQGPPCPALERDGEVYVCGLVTDPQKYLDCGARQDWKHEYLSNLVAQGLGIGRGCDAVKANW